MADEKNPFGAIQAVMLENLEKMKGATQSYIDMLITHALQNGLMRDRVILPGECHVLFAETGKRWGNLRRIGLSLGDNCYTV